MLHNDEICYSLNMANLLTSMFSGSKMPVREGPEQGIATEGPAIPETANAERHVGDGMRTVAQIQPHSVTICMSAQNVTAMATLTPNVSNKGLGADRWANQPHYVRDLVWADDKPYRMNLAAWTESVLPLPSPPANELNNTVALKTIRDNPHLFKIVTPVDIDCLEQLLTLHPNRALVHSLCSGFRDCFWPWAITEDVNCPLVVNNSFRPLSDNAHINFVNQQRDTKVALEHFLPAFGPDLFPGMTSIPIGVVPKPHSDKLHLIVDQSSGDHLLNSFISHEHIAVPLDNLHSLGTSLINVRCWWVMGCIHRHGLVNCDPHQKYCGSLHLC